jgi:hypothetical protein
MGLLSECRSHCGESRRCNAYSTRIAATQGAPERYYEVMTYEAYKAAECHEYLSRPLEEMPEDKDREAFEVLPAEHDQNTGGMERFLMSEHWSGPYTH